MATKVGEAYVELTAKSQKLRTSLKTAEGATSSWTSRMGSSLAKFGKVAFAAAAAGVAAITALMIKATRAAAAEEIQTAQLAHQIQRLGINSEAAMREVDSLAASQQSLTRFGDTDTRKMLAQMIMLTNDYEGSMKNLSLAQDMAESGMFDMNSASKYVGMAMQGNIEMLGRYIPELKSSVNEELKSMDASQKAAYAMELLREKFGGLAKQMGTTTAGAWAKLKNAASDAMEAMGAGALGATSEGLDEMTRKIKDMEPELRKLGEAAGWVVGKLAHAAKWWVDLFTDAEEQEKKRHEQVKGLIEDFDWVAQRIHNLREQQVLSAKEADTMLAAWEAPLTKLREGEISYEAALDRLIDLEVNFEKHRERIQEEFANRRIMQWEKKEAEEKAARLRAMEVFEKELQEKRMKRMGYTDAWELNQIDKRFKAIHEKIKGHAELERIVEEERLAAHAEYYKKKEELAAKAAERIAKKEQREAEKAQRAEEKREEDKIAKELEKNKTLLDALKSAEQDFLRATGQMWIANREAFERQYDEMLQTAGDNAHARELIEEARAARLKEIIREEAKEMDAAARRAEQAFRPTWTSARSLWKKVMTAEVAPTRPEVQVEVKPSDEDKKHTGQFDEMIGLLGKQVKNTESGPKMSP